MAKFTVTLLYDASETIEVEADSCDEAIDLAGKEARANLCYHCSRHLDLGDVYTWRGRAGFAALVARHRG